MPTTLKFLTVFSESAGYGWTETHNRLDSSDNPNMETQLNNFITNIGQNRALFLGEDSAIVGFRVSYPRNNVNASFGLQRYIPGVVGKTGAAPSLSLAVAMKDITFTRQKIIHVRGFWDEVEVNGVYQPGLEPLGQFNLRLAQWKDQLIIGGYGWNSKDAALSAVGTMNSYIVGPTGIVSFTLGGTGLPLGAVGTQQQVRFSRINRSDSVLNKSILCNVITRTLLQSVTPHAAVEMSSSGRYNFRGTSFVSYNNLGSITLGERRMGKPLNRSPGRSKARPTA